jgi:diguanylate cyclase (GGDEF)-like protein
VTQQFAQRALLETVQRTKSGIFVYPVLWLFIGLLKGVAPTHLTFWAINLVLFCLTALCRYGLNRKLGALVQSHFGIVESCFATVSLAPPLHWGLLTALTFADTANYGAIQVPMLVVGCGIAAAGSLTYSILRWLAIAFIASVLVPLLVSLMLAPTDDNLLLSILTLVFGIYINMASMHISSDFWSALRHESLLAENVKTMETLSLTDSLTQLPNRRYFDSQFETEWRRAQRQQTVLSILLIDIDHFKAINDQHGHDVGDMCLQKTGKVIASQILRAGDFAARYGGEEFIVLLCNADLKVAQEVSNRIMDAVRQIAIAGATGTIHVRCSIGGSAMIPDLTVPSALVKAADVLLFRAKQGGRNRAIVADLQDALATTPQDQARSE